MRLRELRLKGFKSFANDTRVKFDEQIIGIVGPNGSGKSNVVDAVRWVLGEQKTTNLRLDTMTDVIFNGTKARKKSGIAEVQLIFDNTKNILPTDYKEVAIGRAVYRSGDSEYTLNGVRCRRKDIQNLFIDTGIGSNSYAIIALGMVEDILLDKDNARRKMFEQAAGISKFKIRKRETLLKLNSTQGDLERVKDILHELDINMSKLEKQAKRTSRFYEIKEQYKVLSISLSAASYTDKSQKITELKKVITSQEDEYRTLNNKVTTLDAEIEKSKAETLDKEQDLSKNQKEFNELVDSIRNKESEKQINLQEKGFSEQSIIKIENSLKELELELNTLQQDINPLQSNKSELVTALSSLQLTFNAAQTDYLKIKDYLSKLDGGADGKATLLTEQEEKLFELEKQQLLAQNDLERNQKQLVYIEDQRKETNSASSTLRTQFTEIEGVLSKFVADKDQVLAQAAQSQERLNELSSKLEIETNELRDLRKQKEVKENEFGLLKGMIDNLEGFPDSAKFLIENNKDKAILFSDIFDCKKDFKAGLEVFLEPYLGYFICDNYQEAMASVSLLNASQKGKANFFILDQIPEQRTRIGCDIPGTTSALEVLEIDSKYLPLAYHLLNGVYFADNWNDSMFAQLPERITIIDKGGRFSVDKRTLKGGSVGLFEGKKIGRKKTLEKLTKQIKDLESKIVSKETALEQLKEQRTQAENESFEDAITALTLSIENSTKEKIQIETNLEVYTNKLNSLNEEEAKAKEEIESKSKEIGEVSVAKESNKKLLQELKDEIDKDSGELEKIRSEADSLSQKYNESNIALLQQQNLVDQINQDIDYKKERIQRLTSDKQNYTVELKDFQEKVINAEAKSKEVEVELKSAYEVKNAMETSLSKTEQDYFSQRSTINDRENQATKLRRSLTEKQVKVNEMKSDLQSLNFDLNAIRDRLKIEFQLVHAEIENIIADADPEEATPEMEEKVGKLRRRIENYGDINPLAVQAYDEVRERHDTIAAQRDDILEAKESLLETIAEIEKTASEQFMEAFNKANDYFKEVFRSLFSEDDTCDLILKDNENPLDSEIEIVARPKGKRPKTLRQLSGGESTLTATALLFALYLLKPAPFCIFDEVDAPLDDHNVVKFTRLIRDFSKRSQFVIITHNKATMAAVDTLYGVYMAEKGVSGITQVDLRDYEHEEVFRTANT